MEEMIKNIEDLPEVTQKEIKDDIENRILAKARDEFEDRPEEFKNYIESEIDKHIAAKHKILDESQVPGAMMFNISLTYVFNKECIRALRTLEKELLRGTEKHRINIEPQQETEREKKYFAKAIEAGLMKKNGDSYSWLHNNGLKASLGYFLNKVFNPKGTAQIPYQRMENLFNVSRLDTATDQALTAKKPQKWRNEIDPFFDD